jgi:predicted DNA-binding protein (UPF0251 family)
MYVPRLSGMEFYEQNGSIANEGSPSEDLEVEYVDGSKVLRTENRKCEYRSADGKSVTFKNGLDDRSRSHIRRAISYAELEQRLGTGFDEEAQVPVSVAVEGKPAMATYLWGVEGLEIDEISSLIGVSNRTVSQYLTDVRKGGR